MTSEAKNLFMLCASLQEEEELNKLDRTQYKAQIKFDGERVMCLKQGDNIILFNRRGNVITYKFKEVVEAFSKLEDDFLIDGEVINIDETIGGNFNLLSRRALTQKPEKIKLLEKEIPVKFMAFDILRLNTKNLMNEPLEVRFEYLQNVITDDKEHLQLAKYEDINSCLKKVIEAKGEGIVIKNMKGSYESKRSKNCYKHKLFKETTINITGFTDNNAGIRATDELGNAVQISGSQSNEVKNLLEQNREVSISVQYLTKSKEGRMRFPSYRGLANENI